MTTVTSTDGTAIACELLGSGPPVIIVGGLLCDRAKTHALAAELAAHATVVNYDRRGRGDSTSTTPYAVERELDDLAVLLAVAGGSASVYGHSSGAALALVAAAHVLPITALIRHEPPMPVMSKRNGKMPATSPGSLGRFWRRGAMMTGSHW
jgi:pimeloyl-ACP methyl ester carboxylesterase